MDDTRARKTTIFEVPIVGEVYSDVPRKMRLEVASVTDKAGTFKTLRGEETWFRAAFQVAFTEKKIVMLNSKKDNFA